MTKRILLNIFNQYVIIVKKENNMKTQTMKGFPTGGGGHG